MLQCCSAGLTTTCWHVQSRFLVAAPATRWPVSSQARIPESCHVCVTPRGVSWCVLQCNYNNSLRRRATWWSQARIPESRHVCVTASGLSWCVLQCCSAGLTTTCWHVQSRFLVAAPATRWPVSSQARIPESCHVCVTARGVSWCVLQCNYNNSLRRRATWWSQARIPESRHVCVTASGLSWCVLQCRSDDNILARAI